MIKVEITTDRNPWINGKPAPKGAIVTIDTNTFNILNERGWCVKIEPKKKAK